MKPAVRKVQEAISEHGLDRRVIELAVHARTSRQAADALGVTVGQIVKSLVFDCDGRAVVVLVPGDKRADAAKVARAAGCTRARVAGASQVEAATGFAPGAVAPFPLRAVDRVLMERTLLAHDLVWVGAGSSRHMAALAPAELARLARARPMDAIQDGT